MTTKTALGWDDPPARRDADLMAFGLDMQARAMRRSARRWARLKGNTAPTVGLMLDTAAAFEHHSEQLRHGVEQ